MSNGVKFKPLLGEIREKLGAAAFANVEKLATRYTEMADRVKIVEERIRERYLQARRD